MAEKKMTAAQKKAAEEAAAQAEAARKETERKRLMGAGAILAAVALFVGGYAVGNAQDDDRFVGSDVVISPFDFEPGEEGFPFPEDFEFDDRRGPRGDDDRRGPRGGGPFGDGFEFPHDFDFDFPEGFDFEGLPFFDEDGRGGPGFFPEGGFGFSLTCTPDGECTFELPEGFDFEDGFEFPPPGRDEAPGDDDGFDPGAPGFLGVAVVDSDDGVLVTELAPGSPAVDAGIQPGDTILEVDGDEIDVVEDLVDAIQGAGAGATADITVGRGQGEITFEVTLSAPPA